MVLAPAEAVLKDVVVNGWLHGQTCLPLGSLLWSKHLPTFQTSCLEVRYGDPYSDRLRYTVAYPKLELRCASFSRGGDFLLDTVRYWEIPSPPHIPKRRRGREHSRVACRIDNQTH